MRSGQISPLTLGTDNGGPFRSFRVRERGFESLKYERLYREDITDALELVAVLEPPARGPHRPSRPIHPTFERVEIAALLGA